MLTARVGAGNARVRVNVDLTSAREVVVEQSFNPEQQVVRSTESTSEDKTGTEGGGNVGVENNIPAALQGDGSGATNSQSRSGEVVQYEIGNTRREIIREAGDIERISVAVLVNGIYNVEGNDVIYEDRAPEEIARLAELVKTAVGFSAARGDEVSVDSLRFMDYSMEVGDPVTMSIMDQITRNFMSVLRALLGLGIVALIMILGVRPALRTLLEQPQQVTTDDAVALTGPDGEPIELPTNTEGDVISADPANPQQPLPSPVEPELAAVQDQQSQAEYEPRPVRNGSDPEAPGATSIFDINEDDGPHEYIETLGVRGSLIKARVEAIQNMAEEKPDEVLRVLRSWLHQEAEA
jgi:flagellar M-ring protein FliF